MKSAVSGLAGAVRVDQLTMGGLATQERHGKRLDEASKSRRISKAPPLTTTGLDLKKLYAKHVAGAFIPRARAKAMHMIIQFPTELVDGNDGDTMLQHAREFAKQVFGDEAIFADRLDRDEKSQHVVDIFVAPRYIKKTKHEEKVAVTMSRHLKAVAEKHGYRKLTPRACGKALQDALLQYLREDMGLKEAQRGSPKILPGSDWKSSEELRVAELDELKSEAEERARHLEERERLQSAVANDLERREREARERDRAAADEVALLEKRRKEIETDRAAIDADRAVVAATLARAEAEWAAARDGANRYVEEARLDREAAAALKIEIAKKQVQVEQDLRRHERQLVLLEHAMQPKSLLRLREGLHPTGDYGFVMDEQHMSSLETTTYKEPWTSFLAKVARRLAQMLERVRLQTARLLEREKEVDAREDALAIRTAESERDLAAQREAQRAELDAALRDLRAQTVGLRQAEEDAARMMSSAVAKEAAAEELVVAYDRWAAALTMIADNPDVFKVDERGVNWNRDKTKLLGKEFGETLKTVPPAWADLVLSAQIEVAEKEAAAVAREREAADSVNQLGSLIRQAGPALTPAQEDFVKQTRETVRQVAPWAISELGRE